MRDDADHRDADTPEEIDALLARAVNEAEAGTRLVDVAVVARRLGVTSTTVRNWINTGKLRAGRTPSGRYRVPISELARIIKAIEAQESKS